MKKFFLPAIAVALAVSASAFTNKTAPAPAGFTVKYWTYNLYGTANQDLQSNLDNPSNYTQTANNGQTQLVCSGSAHRCGVQASESSGKPIMSGAQIFVRN